MKAKNFDAPVNDPFTVREKHCKSRDGKDIWGKVYIPNTAEAKKPLVVMAHGYNSSHGEPQAFAESLAMHGVASYIFDFCGGGNNSKSEGATTDMTIFTEKDNVEDITRTVKSWDFVDPERVASWLQPGRTCCGSHLGSKSRYVQVGCSCISRIVYPGNRSGSA